MANEAFLPQRILIGNSIGSMNLAESCGWTVGGTQSSEETGTF